MFNLSINFFALFLVAGIAGCGAGRIPDPKITNDRETLFLPSWCNVLGRNRINEIGRYKVQHCVTNYKSKQIITLLDGSGNLLVPENQESIIAFFVDGNLQWIRPTPPLDRVTVLKKEGLIVGLASKSQRFPILLWDFGGNIRYGAHLPFSPEVVVPRFLWEVYTIACPLITKRLYVFDAVLNDGECVRVRDPIPLLNTPRRLRPDLEEVGILYYENDKDFSREQYCANFLLLFLSPPPTLPLPASDHEGPAYPKLWFHPFIDNVSYAFYHGQEGKILEVKVIDEVFRFTLEEWGAWPDWDWNLEKTKVGESRPEKLTRQLYERSMKECRLE